MPNAVLAGEQPDQQEDQQQRCAEAEADQAGEGGGDDQHRTDENHQIHRFDHLDALPLAVGSAHNNGTD